MIISSGTIAGIPTREQSQGQRTTLNDVTILYDILDEQPLREARSACFFMKFCELCVTIANWRYTLNNEFNLNDNARGWRVETCL